MKRRAFLSSGLVLLGWIAPKLALSFSDNLEGVKFVEELFDYGGKFGLCGSTGDRRAGVLINVRNNGNFAWDTLSLDDQNKIRERAKNRVLHHLATESKFCRYDDDIVEGNEELLT